MGRDDRWWVGRWDDRDVDDMAAILRRNGGVTRGEIDTALVLVLGEPTAATSTGGDTARGRTPAVPGKPLPSTPACIASNSEPGS